MIVGFCCCELCGRVLSCFNVPTIPLRPHVRTHVHLRCSFHPPHLQTDSPRSSAPCPSLFSAYQDRPCLRIELHSGTFRSVWHDPGEVRLGSHMCPVIRLLSFLFKSNFHLLSHFSRLYFLFLLLLFLPSSVSLSVLITPIPYPPSLDQTSAGV